MMTEHKTVQGCSVLKKFYIKQLEINKVSNTFPNKFNLKVTSPKLHITKRPNPDVRPDTIALKYFDNTHFWPHLLFQ